MISEAQKRATAKYIKKHYVTIHVKFKLVDDKELIDYIKSQPLQNAWIVKALYQVMQEEKNKQ